MKNVLRNLPTEQEIQEELLALKKLKKKKKRQERTWVNIFPDPKRKQSFSITDG